MILRRRSPIRLGGRGVVALMLAMALVVGFPAVQFAHDIPSRVTVLAFIKPEPGRLRIVLRAPLEAMRDVNFPVARPGLPRHSAKRPAPHRRGQVWIADDLELYENGARSGAPRDPRERASRCPPTARSRPSTAPWRSRRGRAPDHDRQSYGSRRCSTSCSTIRSLSDRSRFSIRPDAGPPRRPHRHRAALPPAGGGERDFEYVGDPGLGRARSALASGRAAVRRARVRAHPRRDRPSAVHLLSRHSVPKIRPLVAIVTSFTVAHSITLIASAPGLRPTACGFRR